MFRHPDGFDVLPTLHLEGKLSMSAFYEGHQMEIAAAHAALPQSPPEQPPQPPPQSPPQQQPQRSVSDDDIPPPSDLRFTDEGVELSGLTGSRRRPDFEGGGGDVHSIAAGRGNGGTAMSEGMHVRAHMRGLVAPGGSEDGGVAGGSGCAAGADGRGLHDVDANASTGEGGAAAAEQPVPWPEDAAVPFSGVRTCSPNVITNTMRRRIVRYHMRLQWVLA